MTTLIGDEHNHLHEQYRDYAQTLTVLFTNYQNLSTAFSNLRAQLTMFEINPRAGENANPPIQKDDIRKAAERQLKDLDTLTSAIKKMTQSNTVEDGRHIFNRFTTLLNEYEYMDSAALSYSEFGTVGRAATSFRSENGGDINMASGLAENTWIALGYFVENEGLKSEMQFCWANHRPTGIIL